ncbi:MAG: sigma-70 family RNA polymerase sigma factor [Alphaproteobacteria bacterium]|nr:sigma-70 family RNA polymerase sigma factor [Alphaproteobacteria bacterium]
MAISALSKQNIGALPDEALAALLQQSRSHMAYQELVLRYAGKMWRLARQILQDEEAAHDVVQDVLLSLWQKENIWAHQAGAKFSTWLYRVTLNRAIDHKRRRKAGMVEIDKVDVADTADLPEIIIDNAALKEKLKAVLKKIPFQQAQALSLFYFEEYDVPEICQRMGATENAVRSLLKRGKQSLRDKIGTTLQSF